MSDDDEHRLVDNPQRAWLMSAKAKVDPAVASLRSCLTPGQNALTGGAWTGPRASTWEQEFDGRVRTLRRGAQQVLDELSHEIAIKPAQVCECQVFAMGPTSPFGGADLGVAPYPSVSASCSR